MRVVRLRALLALVACALAGGCYTARATIPGTWRPAAPNEDVVVVGRVDREATHWFFLGGLFPPPSPDLYAAPLLSGVAASGGDGVANVVLDAHFTPVDIIIRAATLGIVAPRTYRVRADIVRLRGPPPPGKPLLHGRRAALPPSSPSSPAVAPAAAHPEGAAPPSAADPAGLEPPAPLGPP